MKIMQASEIPAFVEEVISAGCDICAIDDEGYVIGDIEEMHKARAELRRISDSYGDRDFLRKEIAAYLRSLGRYLDTGSTATHWTENKKPN